MLWFAVAFILIASNHVWSDFIKDITNCPCSETSLCQPVQNTTRKEIFVFSLRKEQNIWSKYDWNKVTTVVMVGYNSQDLMCYAHKHGARVVTLANIPKPLLLNDTARNVWVGKQLSTIQSNYLDGINIDFEEPIYKNETNYQTAYTHLVSEAYTTFKKANPAYQVTVDVAWSPDGIDQRNYNYTNIAEFTDFLFVMAYDEQSQILGQCVAKANSPVMNTLNGLKGYVKLGISSDKLVLGVPWYGYMYNCINFTKDDICYIKHVPFRGVNCSDAAGRQINFSEMKHYLNYSSDGVKWNYESESPYFNFKLDNRTYQMQFDNPTSLLIKFEIVGHYQNIRGYGMWNADAVDYISNTTEAIKERTEMWGSFPKF